MATRRKTTTAGTVRGASVRILPEQDQKLKELALATHTSVNKYVQFAVSNFIELEWETRMAKQRELESYLAAMRRAKWNSRTW